MVLQRLPLPLPLNTAIKLTHHPSSTTAQPNLSYKLPKSDGSDYKPPFCPGARCGTCYTVTNPRNGNKVTVQIIDACPANTAFNYCKGFATNSKDIVEPRDRCGDPGTNSLDLDESAYSKLSDDGEGYQAGQTPNLDITIEANPNCKIQILAAALCSPVGGIGPSVTSERSSILASSQLQISTTVTYAASVTGVDQASSVLATATPAPNRGNPAGADPYPECAQHRWLKPPQRGRIPQTNQTGPNAQ
ncbi:MAG: hypothetical protein Q9200_001403 [Gallowayella weberi]